MALKTVPEQNLSDAFQLLVRINRAPDRGVLMNIISLCVIIFFKIVFLLIYIGNLRLEICWNRILKVRYFSIDWSDKVR